MSLFQTADRGTLSLLTLFHMQERDLAFAKALQVGRAACKSYRHKP